MTDFSIFPVDRLNAHLQMKSTWTGSLLFSLLFAPEKPAPGKPGKDAGDITMTGESTGIVSLGAEEKLTAEILRRVGGSIARWATKNEVASLAIDLSTFVNLKIEEPCAALTEGLLLGVYRFDHYKSDTQATPRIEVSLLVEKITPAETTAVERAQIITSAVNMAREWAHEPANVINPLTLADRARQVAADFGLKCSVLDDAELTQMGAGGITNVGMGSKTPACMIILEYAGNGDKSVSPVVLVGKALTFDSGGYSLKDSTNIQTMKYDKCGGIAVIATIRAAAALKLSIPIVGVIAAAENMISSEAYRPDDIIKTLAGKTVEIVTTDAEGRLVLADALTYAQQISKPRAIIDLATLTGGVVVALGRVRAGIMSNNDTLNDQLIQAGETTFERLWRLPLDEDYIANIKGDDADLKNSGGREGHATYGGLFLKQFVADDIPWAHLDIAGVADSNKELPYCPKGGTGFGIRLLMEYLTNVKI